MIIGLEAFQDLESGDYNEIGLTASHDLAFRELTLTPGFTWLWFPDDSNDTAELSLGFALPLVEPGLSPFFDMANLANGAFIF